MNKRRDFIKASGALAFATILRPSDIFAGSMAKKKPIGLQLYSVREDMKEDPQGTLRMVASIGYKSLESASYADGQVYGMEPVFSETIYRI
jgi:hypothetical protein